MDSLQIIVGSSSQNKKRKNFLWSMKPEWIAGLLQIMTEYVDANMRSSQGFKDAVYHGAAKKFKEKFGVEVTSEQCKNQIRHQRSIWSHIQELKRKSGVSWDESNKMIVLGHEEYTSHIQAFPRDVAYLNMPIANYTELEKVCGEGHATGEWAKSGNSRTPLGLEQINLDDVEPSQFAEINIDASQTYDRVEEEINEDIFGKKKRSISPSSKESAPKRRSKKSTIDRTIGEYIVMMANSVTQVANAIESSSRAFANAIENTTRVSQEKKVFTELITELSSVPGFTEEEVDVIYGNLSKNPTMIQSFLLKSIESKARWMRKELDK